MPVSKAAHHRAQIEEVCQLTGVRAPSERADLNALRKRLDALGDESLLRAGVADFLVDISKQTGARWRKNEPPHSPFFPMGTSVVAKKGLVLAWAEEWHLCDAVAGRARDRRMPAGTALDLIDEFLSERQPWIRFDRPGGAVLMGHVAWLPVEGAELLGQLGSEAIDLHWARPTQVLRGEWWMPAERYLWQSLTAVCHRLAAGEIESEALGASTPEPGA